MGLLPIDGESETGLVDRAAFIERVRREVL